MPGSYKLGFWYDTASFPDQAFDDHGLSLASPASDGVPAGHNGDYSLYGVIDQTLWRNAGGARTLNGILRIMGAPADRNLISFSVIGGMTLTAPFPGRDNDNAGIEIGIAQVRPQAALLNREEAFFTGSFVPVRGTETVIELTYQAQLTPWLQAQPDAQFVVNPGGGLVNPDDMSQPLHNDVVVGVRTNITF